MQKFKNFFFIIGYLVFATVIFYHFDSYAKNIYCTKKIKKQRRIYKAARFFGEIIVDAVMLQVKLFTMQSVHVIAGFTPFYLASRMVDERLQNNFYDHTCHANIYQLPQRCHDIAHYGVGVPMVFLSSLAVWGWNEDLRMTARMFAIGLPFVHSGKDIIKKLRFKSCLRPWHEKFDKNNRSSGGFPSGHMANAVYMTALFGMRHGAKWGIPLGIFASFVFVDFLNCNRHYLSQLVAGAGLGLLFAYAANAVISQKLEARWSIECVTMADSSTAFNVTYRF